MAPVCGIINVFLNLSVSFVDLTAIRHFVSSAEMKGIANLIHSGRSLIKMMKSRGPSTLPCGTPESTLRRADIESPILTHWIIAASTPSAMTIACL